MSAAVAAAPRPGEGAGRTVLLLPRALHPDFARALDALPPAALPGFAGAGRAADAGRLCRAAAAAGRTGPGWLARWLAEDVMERAGLLAMVTRAPCLRFRLGPGGGEPAPGLRLVAVYRGPGVVWDAPGAGAPRRLGRGDVAVLPGGAAVRADPADGAGLVLTVEADGRA